MARVFSCDICGHHMAEHQVRKIDEKDVCRRCHIHMYGTEGKMTIQFRAEKDDDE